MPARQSPKRKILMPVGTGRIPEEAIRRAIAEVKAERERKQRASRMTVNR